MQNLTSMLIDASFKSAAILLLAMLITLAMRRSSAAARHLVWTGAIVSVLALPAMAYLLPGLAIMPAAAVQTAPLTGSSAEEAMPTPSPPPVATPQPRASVPPAAHNDAAATAPAAEPPIADVSVATSADEAAPSATAQLLAWLPWIWLSGTLFALLPLALGHLSLLRLRRTARAITEGPWHALHMQLRDELRIRRPVTLLRSSCRTMPMTWGALPGVPAKVLLPEEADAWSADRRRAVLMHELAHVKRRDGLTQLLAHTACALYWPNPLVWLAAHRMFIERERACDDTVLLHDTKSSDYAEHLLEIATGPQATFFAAHAGIAVARRSKLDGRLVAILDKHRNRRAMSRLGTALTITLLGAIAIPVAMLTAEAPASETESPRPPRATIFDNVHAELLGVSEDVEEPARWWSGRGAPLDHAPTAHPELAELVSFGEMMAPSRAISRGVLLRLKGFKDEPPIILLDADRASTARSWVAQHEDVVEIKHELKVADDQASTHLRYDIFAGPWETFASTDGREATAFFTRDVRRLQLIGSSRTFAQTGELRQEGQRGIRFLPAAQERDALSIAVAHELLEHLDLRLVAVDNEGRLHEPAETFVRESTRTERQTSFRIFREPNPVIDSRVDMLPAELTVYRFNQLPLEQVAEFRLQTPLTRFEFRNVSLQPGHETEVEVVVPETEARSSAEDAGSRSATARPAADVSDAGTAPTAPRPPFHVSANEKYAALVGLRRIHPERGQYAGWWQPDGSRLTEEPYPETAQSGAGGEFEVAFRVSSPDVELAVRVPQDAKSWHVPSREQMVELERWDIAGLDHAYPMDEPVLRKLALARHDDDQRSLDFQLGMTVGEWNDVVRWDFPWKEPTLISDEVPSYLDLVQPEQRHRNVLVRLAHEPIEQAARLILVDRDGKRHVGFAETWAAPGPQGENGPLATHRAYLFPNLAMDDTEAVILQTQPYTWVKFRNVSLRPGHEADVESEVRRGDVSDQADRKDRAGMVRVQGEVPRPGAYSIPDDGLTLIQLLMSAGNMLNDPDPHAVPIRIIHETADDRRTLRYGGTLGALIDGDGVNPSLRGGDIVLVGDAEGQAELERQPLPAAHGAGRVYVGGDVTRPGAYVLPDADDLALRTFLISVGIVDEERADTLFADVLRQTPDGRLQRATRVPLAALLAGEGANPTLRRGDVVLVREVEDEQEEPASNREIDASESRRPEPAPGDAEQVTAARSRRE